MNFYLDFVATAFFVILAFKESGGTCAYQDENCSTCKVTMPGPSLAMCGGSTVHRFMTILEQFLRSQCDVEDPCHQITPPATLYSEYDFIVVGGGSAGAVVASRLSEVPSWKVLLVEAGVNEPTGSQVPSFFLNSQRTSVDWQYKTEPGEMACLGYPEQRCTWPRGKVIGGTSVLNGMMYMRGNRKDYDKWEALGNPGWAYEQVLPYFLKSENNLQVDEMDQGYHSVGGLLPVSRFPYAPPMAKDILAAAEELGLGVGDLNGKRQEGFAIAQTTSVNGIRYSTSRAFLRPVLNRTNLHILLNTTATRVLIHLETKRTYGVEVITALGEKMNITARKEIVISGGAVNSPQILLLSGIGNQTELESVNVPVVHNLPGVGRNLHNHVSFQLQFYVNDTSTKDLNWASAMQYMLSRRGPLSGTALSQVTGFIKSKFASGSEDYPDIQLFFGGYLADCADTGDVDELASSTPRVVSISPTVIQTKSTGYLMRSGGEKEKLQCTVQVQRMDLYDLDKLNLEGSNIINLSQEYIISVPSSRNNQGTQPSIVDGTFGSQSSQLDYSFPLYEEASTSKQKTPKKKLCLGSPLKSSKRKTISPTSIKPKLTKKKLNRIQPKGMSTSKQLSPMVIKRLTCKCGETFLTKAGYKTHKTELCRLLSLCNWCTFKARDTNAMRKHVVVNHNDSVLEILNLSACD